MINSLDEMIEYCEAEAKKREKLYEICPASESELFHCDGTEDCKTLKNGRNKGCQKCAKEYRQLAEWLRELKESRMVLDVLGQFLVDTDIDVCCEDLMNNEEEQKICEKYCTFKTRGCWIRWAKMKASEVNADDKR